MLRLIALYLYYRDLQEERSFGQARSSAAPAAARAEAANETHESRWATKLAA